MQNLVIFHLQTFSLYLVGLSQIVMGYRVDGLAFKTFTWLETRQNDLEDTVQYSSEGSFEDPGSAV